MQVCGQKDRNIFKGGTAASVTRSVQRSLFKSWIMWVCSDYRQRGDRFMQNWIEDYYIGAGIKNPQKTRKKIDAGRLTVGVYLITLSENPGNLLEIIPASLLMQKTYARICPTIVGMEKGKDAAIDMAAGIIKEIYETTGQFQVREYFKNR